MVRISVGAPSRIHSEPHTVVEAQFISMLTFEHREELAQLPYDRKCGWSGWFRFMQQNEYLLRMLHLITATVFNICEGNFVQVD